MIDTWWAVLALVIGFIAGAAFILTISAFIKTRPMDGRRYTGDLPTGPIRQLFHDADNRNHR